MEHENNATENEVLNTESTTETTETSPIEKSFSSDEVKQKLDTIIEEIKFHNRANDPDNDFWCVYVSLLKEEFYKSLK